jgi:hypothetical protein
MSEKSQYTDPQQHGSQGSGSPKKSYQSSTDLESTGRDSQVRPDDDRFEGRFITSAITRTTDIKQWAHAV